MCNAPSRARLFPLRRLSGGCSAGLERVYHRWLRRSRESLCFRLVLLHRSRGLIIVSTLAKLVDASVVDLVGPSLVNVNKENDIVAKRGEPVQERHLDGKGKQVV